MQVASLSKAFASNYLEGLRQKAHKLCLPITASVRNTMNAWGGKGSLWILPIVGVFLYGMMTIFYRYPQICNYPVQLTEILLKGVRYEQDV